MNYYDKLPDFIDGLLEPEEEKEIYKELSCDDTLRSDYKSLNTIFNSINTNINQFAPSKQATEGVFAALGFTMPSEDTSTQSSDIAKSNKSKIHKFYYYSGAVAAAILLLFVFINNRDYNNNLNTLSSVTGTNSSKNAANNNTINNSPNVTLSENSKSKETNSKKIIPISSVQNASPIVEDNNNTTLTYDEEIISNIDLTDDKESKYINMTDNSNTFSDFTLGGMNNDKPLLSKVIPVDKPLTSVNTLRQPQIETANLADLDIIVNKDDYTVELKNSVYFNKNDKKSAKFSNIGLTILYNLDENFAAGIDVRDEPFNVNTQEAEYDNKNYLVNREMTNTEQNFDYTTIGVAVRYSMKNNSDVYPIGQLVLGANRVGMVGRVNVGLCYKPFPSLTTTAGLELSNMNYKNEGMSHNSTKLGLNYGLAYSF